MTICNRCTCWVHISILTSTILAVLFVSPSKIALTFKHLTSGGGSISTGSSSEVRKNTGRDTVFLNASFTLSWWNSRLLSLQLSSIFSRGGSMYAVLLWLLPENNHNIHHVRLLTGLQSYGPQWSTKTWSDSSPFMGFILTQTGSSHASVNSELLFRSWRKASLERHTCGS